VQTSLWLTPLDEYGGSLAAGASADSRVWNGLARQTSKRNLMKEN